MTDTNERFPKIAYVAFGLQGLTIGLFVGWSMSPVVGAVIPPIVTAFAAVSVAVGNKTNGNAKPVRSMISVASLCSIWLCLGLILGAIVGQYMRLNKYTQILKGPEGFPVDFEQFGPAA